jgi:hypothetical protein
VRLLATPIVQLHYFALLIVPLALVRPQLGVVWALPLSMWLCVVNPPWQIAVALALATAMVTAVMRQHLIGPIVPPEPEAAAHARVHRDRCHSRLNAHTARCAAAA